MLVGEKHRKPDPNPLARTFLRELEAQGIPHGPHNLPEWDDHRDSLLARLDSLFSHTSPHRDADRRNPLHLRGLPLSFRLGLQVPGDLSLICLDPHPAFPWFEPTIAHLAYDGQPWMRRLVGWADHVSNDLDDREKRLTEAEFVEGATIAPVPQMTR